MLTNCRGGQGLGQVEAVDGLGQAMGDDFSSPPRIRVAQDQDRNLNAAGPQLNGFVKHGNGQATDAGGEENRHDTFDPMAVAVSFDNPHDLGTAPDMTADQLDVGGNLVEIDFRPAAVRQIISAHASGPFQ